MVGRLEIILATMVVVVLGSIIFFASGETLYDCQFLLESNVETVSLGDEIVLKLVIKPSKKRSITLYDPLQRSVFFNGLTLASTGGESVLVPLQKRKYLIEANSALELQVKGKVTGTVDGKAHFDFGLFGAAIIPFGEPFVINYKVLPAKVRPYDSAEWSSSNSLTLFAQSSQGTGSATMKTVN